MPDMTILDLIHERTVLLDGGLGTELMKRGLPQGTCPELWNIENPDAVKDVYRSFFEAGSDAIVTNSFGGNKIKLNGHPENRIKSTLSYSFLGLEAEAVLLALATKEIYVSTGSACSEDAEEVSHVLLSIGLRPEIARSTIRMSLGRFNSDEDIDTTLRELPDIIEKLRKISAFHPEDI